MNTSNSPRRTLPPADAAPGAGLGVRPGAGVLGLAKAEPAGRTAPQEEPSSQGTLIVGEGIQVKGEIHSCTTLVVEGRVEASLEAAELTVRSGGVFDGTATVETARIGGTFDGTLTVNGLLTIEAEGRVGGTLRYRELRIERGGHLSGDVDVLAEEGTRAKVNSKAGSERPIESAAAR